MFEGNAMRQSQAGSRLYTSAPQSGDGGGTVSQARFGPEIQARYRGVPLLYLGISGVLHPSQSTHELLEAASPWERGHSPYEAVQWLARVLGSWPAARIVLTSTRPWKQGLPAVKHELGPELASRVLGFTYEDLTQHPTRPMRGKAGITLVRHSDPAYWRMSKADIVQAHVRWAEPCAWVALDDEDFSWPIEAQEHCVFVDGSKGLLHDLGGQTSVLCKFAANFGPPNGPPKPETG